MVRKLAYTLLSLLLVLPSAAFALGMGDIRLHSALNQTFNAEIELLSVSADEAESLKVNLASYETFARVGLDRPAALMFLRFGVEYRDGRHFIKITSTEPIREPFLSFLVEASWRSGRLLREYTVLIDPPGIGKKEAPAVQAPVVAATAPATARVPATAVSGTAATAPGAPVDTTASGGLSYGPVKADETLWAIASRMRPNKSVTPQQMMMALLKANPDAFFDNNVNRLKMGYVLRVDDPALISAMSHAEAVRAISAQNRAWQDYTRQAGAVAAERPVVATTAQAARAVATPEEPRLKLVAPEGAATAAAGTSADAAASGELRQELLLAQESAEAHLRENEELRKRMQELEGQLASMQRLLSLKDSDLAAMQQQLGEQRPAGAAPEAVPSMREGAAPAEVPAAASPAPATEAATEAATVEVATPEEKTAVTEPAAETAQPMPVAPVAEEAKPAPAPVAKPARPVLPPAPVEQPSLLDDLLDNPLMLAGAAIVILALLALAGLYVKRRRSGGPGFSESILTAGGTSLLNSKTTPGAPSEESSLFSDLAVSGMNSMQGGDAEVDPLTEADVYMAYGRYQQAEELLKEALGAHPERHDVKVKLLEVYYSTKDRAAFEPLADEVFNALEGNGPLWGKVLVMGHELCPDNPMFSETPEAGAGLDLGGQPAGSSDVLDIGLDLDALAEDMESSADAGGAAFNLDLGVDFSDLEEGTAEVQPAAAVAAEEMVEEPADVVFDLSGLEETVAEPEAQPEPAVTAAAPAEPEHPEQAVEFDLGEFQFDEAEAEAEAPVVTAEEAPAQATEKQENALDFDLGDLGLELGDAAADAPLNLDEVAGEANLADLGELSDLGDLGDLGDLDAVGTKLDLAKAYVDMGEPDSARSILGEVLAEGDDKQKAQAQELLEQLS
jgi:pilus assembly protein FimV